MDEKPEISSGISLDMINVALNTQALCLQHAFEHIARVEGAQAAVAFKAGLLEALRSGSINMALLEDSALFDFVVNMVEAIPAERS